MTGDGVTNGPWADIGTVPVGEEVLVRGGLSLMGRRPLGRRVAVVDDRADLYREDGTLRPGSPTQWAGLPPEPVDAVEPDTADIPCEVRWRRSEPGGPAGVERVAAVTPRQVDRAATTDGEPPLATIAALLVTQAVMAVAYGADDPDGRSAEAGEHHVEVISAPYPAWMGHARVSTAWTSVPPVVRKAERDRAAAEGRPAEVSPYRKARPAAFGAVGRVVAARPTFEEWLESLNVDVVRGEYGYAPGEFEVFPESWRQAYDDGLSPRDAFARSLRRADEARDARDAERRRRRREIDAADARYHGSVG